MIDKLKFTKSVGVLSNITFLNVLFAFINSLLIAYYFGVSRELEIYFAALTLFQLAQKLSHTSVLGEVFIPYLIEYTNTAFYNKFINSIISVFFILSIILIIILFLLSKWLMVLLIPGFSNADIANSVSIYITVLPLLPIVIINSIFDAILQSRKRFGVTEVGVLISQFIGIIFFISTVSLLGIYALLVSFMIAPVIRIVFITLKIKDIIKNFRFELNLKDKRIRYSLLKITPFIGYTLFTQGVLFFTTSVVSFLPQGSLAILKYSQNIFDKISRITTGPIVTVAYVEFSAALKSSVETFTRLFKNVYSYALPVSLLLIVLILLGGQEILSIVFVRGKFYVEDSLLLYSCLLFQVLRLPPAIYCVAARKSLVGYYKTTIANILMIGEQIVFVILILLLVDTYGIIGVILSTTLEFYFMSFIYYFVQKKIFKLHYKINELKNLLIITFVLLLGIIPSLIVKLILTEFIFMDGSVLNQIINLSITFSIYFLSTYFLIKLFKVKELQKIIETGKSILQKFYHRTESIKLKYL